MKKQLPKIKEQVFGNSLYKVTAFFVALAIWVTTLQGHKDFVHWRKYEVQFLLSPNYQVESASKPSIQLHYSGPRSSTSKIHQYSQKLVLNLVDQKPGPKRVEIRASDFNLPTGLNIISIEPKYVDIVISEGSSK